MEKKPVEKPKVVEAQAPWADAPGGSQPVKEPMKEILVPAQVFVSRQYGKNGEPLTKEETLAIHRFVTEPASVSLELGLTLNLGNYETARLSVSITLPCYKEEAHEAYNFARQWVMHRVAQERDAIREKKDTDLL